MIVSFRQAGNSPMIVRDLDLEEGGGYLAFRAAPPCQ